MVGTERHKYDVNIRSTDIDDLKTQLADVMAQLDTAQIALAKIKVTDAAKASRARAKVYTLELRAEKLRESINGRLMVNQNTTILNRLAEITAKNDCLRVRFLDWFADKLDQWSAAIRVYAMSISKPCAIKLPAKKEEKPIALRTMWTLKTDWNLKPQAPAPQWIRKR